MSWEYLLKITGYLLKGSITTIEIWLVTMALAIPISVILALIQVNNIKYISKIISIFTWTFRGTPLLFQLFFVYFGLSIGFGIKLEAFTAAALTFTANWTAYFTDIFRAGINSIDKGQFEAAKTLGIPYIQTIWRIILPQVIIRVLPGITNQAVELVYGTALLSTIGLNDLLKSARVILIRDLSLIPFVIAGVLYLIFNSFIQLTAKKIELKFSKHKL